MRIKKSLIGGLAILVFSLSCDRWGKEPITSNDDVTVFYQKCRDISIFIHSRAETIDFNSVTAFAKELDDFESAEVIDSVLYIHFKEDYTYFFDMYGKTAPDTTGLSQLDSSLVNYLIDSLSLVTQADTLFHEQLEMPYLQGSLQTRANNTAPIVRKMSKNLIYWHSIIHDYTKSELTRLCNQCGVSFKEGSSISDLFNIGYYDIAVISSHGATKGLLVPITYKEELSNLKIYPKTTGTIWTKNNGDDLEALSLSRSDLDKLLPDLSNTIVWAEVCSAGSPFSDVCQAICNDKKALEFYGYAIDLEAPKFFDAFTRWFTTFFKGYWDSQHAFESGNNDPNFLRYSQSIVFYVEGGAMTPIKEEGHLWITAWRKISSRVKNLLSRETRAGGGAIDGSGEGVHLVNIDTNEEKYIPFNSETVQHFKTYEHDDVTRFNIAVDPGELTLNAKYKYASYSTREDGSIQIDGPYIHFIAETSLRDKLIQFYYDTDGPNWTHNDNWCSDKPLEEWYGIKLTTTEALDTLVNIHLYFNNLNGDASIINCKELRELKVVGNSLTSVNLSGCTNVNTLELGSNQISNICLTDNEALEVLHCDNNFISSLNLMDSHRLKELHINYNYVSFLSLSLSCSNTLNVLRADNSGLTTLNVHGYTSLRELSLRQNPIEYLDISQCSSLENLSMFVSSSSEWLNRKLRYLDASGCSSLKELSCGWGNPWGGEKEHGPLSYLDVTNCSSLTSLECHGGSLISLSLKGCYSLRELWCNDNLLQSIDISDCQHIYGINCASNKLSSVSFSGYKELKTLYVCYNQLKTLSMRGCSALEHLECYDNHLTSLDLAGCVSLTGLSCENNELSSLNLSSSDRITHIFADDNKLLTLYLQNKSQLKYCWCSYNSLTEVDISNCPLLESFKITGNRQLLTLSLNNCSSLKELQCAGLGLQSLGVINCSSLESLSCENNHLTTLNTDGCNSLAYLKCQNNTITQQVPSSFMQLISFVHDQKYVYSYDSEGNMTFQEKEYGWYYPGEPEKGYHGW